MDYSRLGSITERKHNDYTVTHNYSSNTAIATNNSVK